MTTLDLPNQYTSKSYGNQGVLVAHWVKAFHFSLPARSSEELCGWEDMTKKRFVIYK